MECFGVVLRRNGILWGKVGDCGELGVLRRNLGIVVSGVTGPLLLSHRFSTVFPQKSEITKT